MIGDKSLVEIRKEVLKRLSAAGIGPEAIQEMLDQLKPPPRAKNPAAVKALVNFAKPLRPKKRSRSTTKSRG
jgi:hypothetical protein